MCAFNVFKLTFSLFDNVLRTNYSNVTVLAVNWVIRVVCDIYIYKFVATESNLGNFCYHWV